MKQIIHGRMQGLSLIELMIAMLIGVILMLGLIQIFSASREAYRLSEGAGRVQENGRFAMDYLQRDLRMIGHFGCVNDQARMQTPDSLRSHFLPGGPLDFLVSVRGYDGAPTGITLNPAPITGSDTVVLRYLSGGGIPVTAMDVAAGTVTVDSAKWSVLTQDGVAAPQLFGVADCAYADIFATASPVAAGPTITVPSTVDLARYGVDAGGGPAMLHRAEAFVYYVANGASGQPSLWRARIGAGGAATSEELVEGIENLQFRFGLDQSADAAAPTGYIATQADATGVGSVVTDWRRVGQVQVGVLAASPERASSEQAASAPLLLGQAQTVADDRRYRHVYESTIALRNRLYGN